VYIDCRRLSDVCAFAKDKREPAYAIFDRLKNLRFNQARFCMNHEVIRKFALHASRFFLEAE
jgi:hypothetical protein